MPDIRMLTPDKWDILQNVRLSALRESPQNFLSTYEHEKVFDEANWRAEFNRGDWYVSIADGGPPDEPLSLIDIISLVGITRQPDTPAYQCFLEYLWVVPEFRGHGVAFDMINRVLDRLKKSGIRTVFLWVLDGNERAKLLYERLGFVSCNHRQPLEARPGSSEELMKLDLSCSVRSWRGGLRFLGRVMSVMISVARSRWSGGNKSSQTAESSRRCF